MRAELLKAKPTEKQFMAQVIKLATMFDWICYHTHDSRRSVAGFPDLVMLKGTRMIVAELKVGKGRVRPEQQLWLDRFTLVGAEVFVWTEQHWPVIQRVLQGDLE